MTPQYGKNCWFRNRRISSMIHKNMKLSCVGSSQYKRMAMLYVIETLNWFCYQSRWLNDTLNSNVLEAAWTCRERQREWEVMLTNLWADSATCWALTQQGPYEKERKHLHRQILRNLACFFDLVFAGCLSTATNGCLKRRYLSTTTNGRGVLWINIMRSC